MEKSSSPACEWAPLRKVWEFADDRLGLNEWIAFGRKKTVPQHGHTFWYYFGGISMFFFLVQVTTGILLLLYYRPGPEAYDSVRQITYDIEFGWLIRSAHSWSANLMVLAVFVHMFSVFFMKAFRKPREFGWWTGLGLLGVTMVFGFSGYLLPMDELAYFATKVGLEIPGSIPIVGSFAADLARGGPTVDGNTVQRFFTLHVVILPIVFGALLGVHLFLVQRHGNAVPPSEEAKPVAERASIPFFPDFLLKDLAMWLVALNLLAILVSLFPWPLGPQADPLTPAPAGIHPEWYFMSQFQLLKVLGNWFPGTVGEILGIGLFSLGGLIWAVIPLLDRSEENKAMARLGTRIGLVFLGALIVLTVWGYMVV